MTTGHVAYQISEQRERLVETGIHTRRNRRVVAFERERSRNDETEVVSRLGSTSEHSLGVTVYERIQVRTKSRTSHQYSVKQQR
jgi:hypothetical protein